MGTREDFEKWAIANSFSSGRGVNTPQAYAAWVYRQPEIDALKEKLESREAQLETVGSIERELRNELARFQAENERLLKDAERYRWLRSHFYLVLSELTVREQYSSYVRSPSPEEMDAILVTEMKDFSTTKKEDMGGEEET